MDKIRNAPKVSVCVVTYNQEKFIRQCLQSLVDQQTSFQFEVIVGDDGSKDGTRAIVQEFAERYPLLVRAIMQPKNLGPSKNYLAVHEAARGEYVAQMDGDDYALPGKLQAQVDCLDSNPAVSFSAHAVRIVGSDKTLGRDRRLPEFGTLDHLLRHGTYFVASSVMYRKNSEEPHGQFQQPGSPEFVDFFLHLERASKGAIHLDHRIFGYYRVHSGGISRNPVFRQVMEDTYEAAFDRALELGASKTLVESARQRQRMVSSIARYLSGDIDGYKQKIRINKANWSSASAKHLVLHLTRFFPNLVGIYARLRGMR